MKKAKYWWAKFISGQNIGGQNICGHRGPIVEHCKELGTRKHADTQHPFSFDFNVSRC